MNIEVYKIKNPFYEQYSSGLRNGYIQKTKKGKTWSTLRALKNHLTMAQRWDGKAFELFYNDWIVLKITENGVEQIGLVKDFK